jgi:hypothetical protein
MTLAEALDAAYRSWAETGHADVPEFAPGDQDPATLAATLATLEAVQDRCVISRTKAAWLRRVTT